MTRSTDEAALRVVGEALREHVKKMFGPWWQLGVDATLLAFESQAVIGLRLTKLAAGGTAAQAEAQRMVSEKILAASEAAMQIATGASTGAVVAGYRRKVRANHRRLSRG